MYDEIRGCLHVLLARKHAYVVSVPTLKLGEQ